MKRNTALTLALCLLLGAALAPDAEAGRKSNNKKLSPNRTEMPAGYGGVHRIDRLPMMEFYTGVLRRDGISGWRVGDYELQIVDDTIITGTDGQAAMLQEGSRVLVMGPSSGSALVGWNVRLLAPDLPSPGRSADVVKKGSDASPDVGELVSAPY